MLTCSVVPRLTHVLKSAPKDTTFSGWMKTVDDAHLSTGMKCIGGETLDADLPPLDREHLAASLDLPPQFGGIGLQSLIRADDEELFGSWASITSDLISFFRSRDSPVYTRLAGALDSMADTHDNTHDETLIPTIKSMLAFSTRAQAFLDTIPETEINFTTSLVMGERTVEITGRNSPLEQPSRPYPIVLPDLCSHADYVNAPCKHECDILKPCMCVKPIRYGRMALQFNGP